MVRRTPATSASTQPGTSYLSPRIRGTLSGDVADVIFNGLIPAHTGNAVKSLAASSMIGAHPRAYGENTHWSATAFSSFGSSPCIQGKLLEPLGVIQNQRLIPVHTGNTPMEDIERYLDAAHPRAYGENGSEENSV